MYDTLYYRLLLNNMVDVQLICFDYDNNTKKLNSELSYTEYAIMMLRWNNLIVLPILATRIRFYFLDSIPMVLQKIFVYKNNSLKFRAEA